MMNEAEANAAHRRIYDVFPKGGDGIYRHRYLSIVGSCPVCGCPIYGRKEVNFEDDQRPQIKLSCDCHTQASSRKTFEDLMHTKEGG